MRLEYTKNLLQLGEERKRLTAQLAELVAAVAAEIAVSVPAGREVVAAGKVYRVVRQESNIGAEYYLAVDVRDAVDPVIVDRHVFAQGRKPGDDFYLHGDFNCRVYVATRGEYLHLANNLPAVVAAFEASEQDVIDVLRQGFEALKAVVSAEPTE